MHTPFNTVGLVGKYDNQGMEASMRALGEFLRGRGHTVLLASQTAEHFAIEDFPKRNLHDLAAESDAVVVLLTLSGTYSDLLDYVICAVLIFYAVTIAGLFVLRRKRPEVGRPYKAFGYPVVPAIYVVAASLIVGVLLVAFRADSHDSLRCLFAVKERGGAGHWLSREEKTSLKNQSGQLEGQLSGLFEVAPEGGFPGFLSSFDRFRDAPLGPRDAHDVVIAIGM